MKYCQQCQSPLKKTRIDGSVRYICQNPQCGRIYWNNPVPVVAALVNYNGKYVIARNAGWPAGIYSVVTGYLEAGEEPETAILREVSEELGLAGKIVHFLGAHIFKEKNQLILAYEVDAYGELELNDELVDYKLLSSGELLEYDFKPLYVTEAIIEKWKRVSHQC